MCGTDKDFYWDFPTYALIVYINYHHVCFPIISAAIYIVCVKRPPLI